MNVTGMLAAGVPKSRIVAVNVCAGPPTTDVALVGRERDGVLAEVDDGKRFLEREVVGAARRPGSELMKLTMPVLKSLLMCVKNAFGPAVAGRVVGLFREVGSSVLRDCSAPLQCRPNCPLVEFGSWQIPSPSKPKSGCELDDNVNWLTGWLELLMTPISVSSTPSYVPGIGSLASVACGSCRIRIPLSVTSMSRVQLVLYPTAGHSVNGGAGAAAPATPWNTPGVASSNPADANTIANFRNNPYPRRDEPFPPQDGFITGFPRLQ